MHIFPKILTKITSYFHLSQSELYTEYCLRRSLATFLGGGDIITLKWAWWMGSTSIAESYREENNPSIVNRIQRQEILKTAKQIPWKLDSRK
jgi:hypothetical protein